MTPADVLGPDGIVYPNWTKCGVQGGIPKVKEVASLSEFGGVPSIYEWQLRNARN